MHGFDTQPTTKYLRTFWLATQNLIWNANAQSYSCPHEYALRYLNESFQQYSDEKMFGLFAFSNVAHGSPNRHSLIDKDLANFLIEFSNSKKRDETIFIVFGDHGSRISEYRATIQGRLEERLPFFSVILPKTFRHDFPLEMKHFVQNSKVLTSYLDIHATLKHLLNFPLNTFNASHGRSLFTDIVSLNRSCDQAGIERHWCPCLDYVSVPTNDTQIVDLTKTVIDHINNLTRVLPLKRNPCAELKISSIIRASRNIPQKEVQQFKNTKRDDKCDACGVDFDKNFKLKTFVYEIVFSVSPSFGKFEATIEHDEEGNRRHVKEISRINKYGDQPKCVAKLFPYLRKFCFCKT